MESTLTKKQVKTFGPRAITGWGDRAMITAEVRYDDECGNGHNSFAITAEIRLPNRRDCEDCEGCGCLHTEVAQIFPELAPFIKWHLFDSTGPMHYLANTMFLAGNKDCWGRVAGEPYGFVTSIRFGNNPIKHHFKTAFMKFLQEAASHPGREKYEFEVIRIDHENRKGETFDFGPKYTFGGYDAKWYECPFDSEQEALDFLVALQTCEPSFVSVATQIGKGKARELDAARNAAVWPDATDEELTAPGLKERLEARLPALVAEFRVAVESLGFTF